MGGVVGQGQAVATSEHADGIPTAHVPLARGMLLRSVEVTPPSLP